MKYKIRMAASIFIGLLAVFSTVTWAKEAAELSEIRLPEDKLLPDTYVLDAQSADVTGDNVDDHIFLIGHKRNKADRYVYDINIIVQNGATNNKETTHLNNFAGYEPKLFIGDFNGDKVNDIMITAPTGGSGGISGHVIVVFNGAEPTVIFDNEDNTGAKFTGKFIDGFKAEVVNENTGRATTIDLSFKKDLYVRDKTYLEDGTLLKTVNPYSYPFTILEPVDYDGDGTYELRGSQRIIGAYGADTISQVVSLWSYQVDRWEIKQIQLSTFLYSQDAPPQKWLIR